MELTTEQLREMKAGIFAQGTCADNATGCNMTGSGKLLRWVAVRGDIADWAIYLHFADRDWDWIRRRGDKTHSKDNIRRLVPCSEEALAMYRH